MHFRLLTWSLGLLWDWGWELARFRFVGHGDVTTLECRSNWAVQSLGLVQGFGGYALNWALEYHTLIPFVLKEPL